MLKVKGLVYDILVCVWIFIGLLWALDKIKKYDDLAMEMMVEIQLLQGKVERLEGLVE